MQPTHFNAIHPAPTSATPQKWGSFLLTRVAENVFHATLTGRLSDTTLDELNRRVENMRRGPKTQFLILDASRLQHIPVPVAHSVADRERGWRDRQIVVVWAGLSNYLVNLLVLACGNEQSVPALADWKTARALASSVGDCPAPIARGHLVTCSALVH